MILVLLGPPGVGKGTQGTRVAVHYDVPTISTGAIFREAVARGTEFGRQIQRYRIDRGEFVPDEVVVGTVRARISEADCIGGFVLDGFPRTAPQADALQHILDEQKRSLTACLDFEADTELLVNRFSGRRVCPRDGSTYHVEMQPPRQAGLCDLCHAQLEMRPDDAPEIVRRRLEVYAEKTRPLIDYYSALGLLYTIDASPEPETVFSQVIALLTEVRRKQV